jgi:hypothetical protein
MAVDRGVEFISERVTSLLWDGDTCTGVRTDKGSAVNWRSGAMNVDNTNSLTNIALNQD